MWLAIEPTSRRGPAAELGHAPRTAKLALDLC